MLELMLSCASSCPLTTKLVNVPFSPVAVVNVLLPEVEPLITALSVPDAPLYALLTVLVSIVPLVYLLAVVVCRLVPAVNGLLSELSAKPAHSLGLVPWKASASVILNALKLLGALGVALIVNVMLVSLSVCAVMSGVPFAVKSKL